MRTKKVMTVFYIDNNLSVIERLDYILQLIQWMHSVEINNMKGEVLFFDKNIKEIILKELTTFPKIARVFLEQFVKINKIFYKKRILYINLKNITSARLEFFGPAYFSRLKSKGLYTHIDVTFTGRPHIVQNGVSFDIVHNKLMLYKGRAKHYKTFRYKIVYFTWAIFLGINNFNYYIDLFWCHEKDVQVKNETYLLNTYRNKYRQYNNGTRLTKFKYNYYCNKLESGDVHHYDSFFKKGKNLYVPNIIPVIENLLLKEIK